MTIIRFVNFIDINSLFLYLYYTTISQTKYDNVREEWYFSIVDVVGSLTESNNPRDYWYRVKIVCQKKRKVNCRQFVDS